MPSSLTCRTGRVSISKLHTYAACCRDCRQGAAWSSGGDGAPCGAHGGMSETPSNVAQEANRRMYVSVRPPWMFVRSCPRAWVVPARRLQEPEPPSRRAAEPGLAGGSLGTAVAFRTTPTPLPPALFGALSNSSLFAIHVLVFCSVLEVSGLGPSPAFAGKHTVFQELAKSKRKRKPVRKGQNQSPAFLWMTPGFTVYYIPGTPGASSLAQSHFQP